VSVDTVQRVLRTPSEGGTVRRRVGRPPLAAAFEEEIRTFLREWGELPTVEILRRHRMRGYAGGKNPVYQMARRLRSVTPPPMGRFDGLTGEFCQCDFGQVRVRYDDGTVERLHFFIA
jgi:hypothetical protein